MKIFLRITLLLLISQAAYSQSFPLQYEFDTYNKINDSLYSTSQRLHTSIKPYLVSDSSIQSAFDTLLSRKFRPESRNFIVRKLFNEHLVEYYKKDFALLSRKS